MKNKEFNSLVHDRILSIQSVLMSKAEEYSSKEDRLHNFKMAARVNNTTPELTLWGMYTKHLISVMDMVCGLQEPTEEMINEKIGDSINYHILLEAILKEKLNHG